MKFQVPLSYQWTCPPSGLELETVVLDRIAKFRALLPASCFILISVNFDLVSSLSQPATLNHSRHPPINILSIPRCTMSPSPSHPANPASLSMLSSIHQFMVKEEQTQYFSDFPYSPVQTSPAASEPPVPILIRNLETHPITTTERASLTIEQEIAMWETCLDPEHLCTEAYIRKKLKARRQQVHIARLIGIASPDPSVPSSRC